MLSDEEKKAIDLLKNIDKQKCMMLECPVVKNNIERQLKIIELNRTIRKQSKEIEELKEKNKEVTNLYCDVVRLLEGDLYEDYKYYKKLASAYQGNSVSKDKIKARIKELEEYLYKGNIKDDFLMIRIKAKIQELQSLLEKE